MVQSTGLDYGWQMDTSDVSYPLPLRQNTFYLYTFPSSPSNVSEYILCQAGRIATQSKLFLIPRWGFRVRFKW